MTEKILSVTAVGERLAVAVSGGRDSMALLHATAEAAKIGGFSFFVVNIEHGIRGETSVRDSEFVQDYCDKNHIEFVCFPVDCIAYATAEGLSTEDAARRLRIAIFDKLTEDGKCDKVLTAHHRSDQAETVLMRIIRGTGVKGLAAMQAERKNIVRPFLDVSRNDIDSYVAANGIPYVTDESNLDNAYTRNLLRNEIIPAMKKISADPESALVRLSRLAAENEEFLQTLDNPVQAEGDVVYMPIIKDEAKLLFKRRVVKCFALAGVTQDVEERHQEIIFGLLDKPNGASLDMPYGVKVSKEYDKIVFAKVTAPDAYEVPFQMGEIHFCGKTISIVPYDGEKPKKGELVFDISKIPVGAVIRTRRVNDRFTKFGGGAKSLGDYMTDKKIPRRLRDNVPLVAAGNDVFIVGGVEISDKVRVDDFNNNDTFKFILSED